MYYAVFLHESAVHLRLTAIEQLNKKFFYVPIKTEVIYCQGSNS
jgi:hypothetical protein